MQPLISVIVPVYKVESYLNKCVDSIINQAYHNLEIILVDDGSPDRCPQMCDEWAEKDCRIKVIHKRNGGIASARNAGLKAVTGSYVSWVDSDDWIEQSYILALYNKLVQYKADIANNCKTTGRLGRDIILYQPQILKKYLLRELDSSLWRTLVPTEFYMNKHFDDFKIGEDKVMLLQIYAQCKKIILFYKPGYHYLQREDSAVHKLDLNQKENGSKAIDWIANYIKKDHPQFLKYLYYDMVCDASHYCRQIRSIPTTQQSKSFQMDMKQKIRKHIFKIPLWMLKPYQIKNVLAAFKILLYK